MRAKHRKYQSGELGIRSFNDYLTTCRMLTAAFGRDRPVAALGPVDFAELRRRQAERLGIVSVGNHVQRTRTVFKFA